MIPFILAAVGGYLIGDSMKSKKFANGGYTDFGYHNINKEVTLKNGEKVFITKGRYYWSNELGDARPSGVYYMTKDKDLISDSQISFPLEMAKGGMTEHGLKSGDKILDTVYYDENTISVMNDGKYAAVDLDKGERIEGIYANGGRVEMPYILWVSKDGEKRKIHSTHKSQNEAEKEMKKLWENSDYKSMGNKLKIEYDKEGLVLGYPESRIMADGGEIEKAARFRADNPNWTNEEILAEYNYYKFKLSEFNAGNIKPSKVIGGGYKSSAIARKLAKKWLEDRLAENKMALEIRGVMAHGGIQDSKPLKEGDLVLVKSKRNKMYRVKEINGEKIKVTYHDGSDYVTMPSDLKLFSFVSSKMANGGIMKRKGESHSDQMIDIMNRDREMGRRMKFQESTLEEDMQEAKEIFGKYWDTLTEKEKIEATKYLKIKGEVGHFGREDDDVQTFMNDLNYKRGGRTNE